MAHVSWTDGPTETDVQQIAIAHTGVQTGPDGAAVRFAFYGASTARLQRGAAGLGGTGAPRSPGIRRDDSDPEFTTGLPEGADR